MAGRSQQKMAASVCKDTPGDTFSMLSANWDDFRVFAMVAREGNFSRAAQELRTTQATVSRRIGALEKALNTTLFDRPPGRGGVSLTFDGRRVLREVASAEVALARTRRTTGKNPSIAGDCKLLGSDGIASFWMPPFLKAFADRQPDVLLKYFLSFNQTLSQRPPFDLQMQYSAGTEADTVALKLATLHFNYLAMPQYVSQFGMPQATADLQQHRVISHSPSLADEPNWSMYWPDRGSVQSMLYTNSSAFQVELVLNSCGIAVLPTYLVALEPRMIPVLPNLRVKATVFLNYQKDVAKKPAVRATIDFLKEFVFDPKTMPWFTEEYVQPGSDWPQRARTLIAEASPIAAAQLAS